MTTATPVRCNRCHRVLTDPDWQAVRLGRVCAERLGLQRKRKVRVRRPKDTGLPEQPSLLEWLGELDNEDQDEINEKSEE